MSSTTIRRIAKEIENARKDSDNTFQIKQIKDDDFCNWKCILDGPKGSVYENCKYILNITYPLEYPFSPPRIKFVSPILHPNISEFGEICLNILKKDDGWSPALSLPKVILCLQNLLAEPNPDSALSHDALMIYRQGEEDFKIKVREMYEKNPVSEF